MNHSEQPSSEKLTSSRKEMDQPKHHRLSKLLYAIIAIAFIGFVDSTYLVVEHYRGEIPTCTIVEGCETVLTSSYSEFYGVPIALFGAIGYVSILVLALLWFDVRRDSVLWAVVILSIIAFFASVWFVYVQLFILHAICQYCMMSATTSTLLFIFSLCMFRVLRIRST